MSNFIKALIALLALFGAAIGTLAIVDRIVNKNRIKGDYLDCDTSEDFEEPEE